MSTYPIFIKGHGQKILVVGSGALALAKLRGWLTAGADVTVVDHDAATALNAAGIASNTDRLTIHARAFENADLAGINLVYAASEDDSINQRVASWANIKKISVNVADQPDKSDFISPALVEHGDLTIAISTAGKAPQYAVKLRALLDQLIPHGIAHVLNVAGALRAPIKDILPTFADRRRFWRQIFSNDGERNLLGHDNETIKDKLITEARLLANFGPRKDELGQVWLVGAGPGDPELLTLKAHRALIEADVVLYDRLVGDDILKLARRDADFVFVGKRESDHGVGQEGIQDLLVKYAREGKFVVRLKGGDPMTFARAGEELTALRAEGVNITVVPGITALAGIGAAAQIPLTERSAASSVTLVTGHLQDEKTQDWAALAGVGRTLAIYMGVKTAGEIKSGLLTGGIDAKTPVAIIENGTRENERQFFTTIGALEATVKAENVKSPALIIVGEVTNFAAALNPIKSQILLSKAS